MTAQESPTPEVGQVWSDNDKRTYGAGEFEITGVDEQYVIVRRSTGRSSRIRRDRLADQGSHGYTFIGKSR